MRIRRTMVVGAALLALVGSAACGSDDDAATTTTTSAAGASATSTTAGGLTPGSDADGSTTTAAGSSSDGDVLRIMITNDDGVSAPGIDAVVEAVRRLPNVEVTVIAPLTNQSGTGSKKTEGALQVTDATTLSGFPAKAVAGFPADTVIYAFEQGGLAQKPHVVLSGDNQGANVGPLVDISGTIGAAKAAAARGVPSLASSQGIATEPDYATGARLVVEWVEEHRAELVAGTAPVTATSINIPTCPNGSIRGEITVPIAADAGGRELLTSNCASTVENPADDVDGFSNGFATYSEIPLTTHA